MKTVILTDEQENFLLGILSHDSDLIEPFVRDVNLSFDTTEDDFDVVSLRDLMSTTVNALMGHQEQRENVHAFHGTRETGAGAFRIDTDRSLDEDLAVLTMRRDDDATFMGWIDGGDCGKYVQVPKKLTPRIVGWLGAAESAGWMCDFDENDLGLIHAFTRAVGRCWDEPTEPQITTENTTPTATKQWVITGPYGWEWQGEAENEIAALDKWVDETMPDMARYSDTILQQVLEGSGPGEVRESLSVYRHEGVIHAIHSNYEVRVIEGPLVKPHVPAAQLAEPVYEALNKFVPMNQVDEACASLALLVSRLEGAERILVPSKATP